MGLKKLFEVLKQNKENRKDWHIEWKVRCVFDTDGYMFAILPTVIWVPWPYRRPGECVVTILWLNCGLGFGEWRSKDK